MSGRMIELGRMEVLPSGFMECCSRCTQILFLYDVQRTCSDTATLTAGMAYRKDGTGRGRKFADTKACGLRLC